MDQNAAFEIVNKYLQKIKSENISIEGAYIFGSYARGTFHKDSDIDLALVFTDLHDRIFLQTELLKLGRDFNYIIEPHPIDKTDFNHSHPLAHEILGSGIKVA